MTDEGGRDLGASRTRVGLGVSWLVREHQQATVPELVPLESKFWRKQRPGLTYSAIHLGYHSRVVSSTCKLHITLRWPIQEPQERAKVASLDALGPWQAFWLSSCWSSSLLRCNIPEWRKKHQNGPATGAENAA